MTPFPARYKRASGSKIAGCLVYLAAAPFVALFLALFLSAPVALALQTLGLPRESGNAAFVVLLPLIGVGVAVWGYRDYRRRAALEVVIDRDRVTIGMGQRWIVLRFEDVASIRFVPARADFAIVLVPRSGKALRLPHEIAPFALACEPLEATLIPEMVRRLDERVACGEAVTLRISSAKLFVTMSRAFGALVMSLLLLVRPSTFRMGSLVARHSVIVFRQSWLGIRGGLVIEREGLRRYSETLAESTTWDRLERVRSDSAGLVLRSEEGRFFAVSALVDDYWPALRWIDARVK